MCVNGVPHAQCKTCGWNTTHSTKYHNAAINGGSAFKLADECPDHPLVKLQRSAQPGTGQAVPPPTSNGLAGAASITVDASKAKAVLDNLERNAASADTPEIVSALRSLLHLN